jgi:hypothetical protein
LLVGGGCVLTVTEFGAVEVLSTTQVADVPVWEAFVVVVAPLAVDFGNAVTPVSCLHVKVTFVGNVRVL